LARKAAIVVLEFQEGLDDVWFWLDAVKELSGTGLFEVVPVFLDEGDVLATVY
jgi:hypothetical protein